ncbi:unnamed protein product [Parajaminaea phylloscopi]
MLTRSLNTRQGGRRRAPYHWRPAYSLALLFIVALQVASQQQRASPPSSERALVGPFASTQPIEDAQDLVGRPNADPNLLWWSEIPAVQLAREYPHRWKSFLPSAAVVIDRDEEATRKLAAVDDTFRGPRAAGKGWGANTRRGAVFARAEQPSEGSAVTNERHIRGREDDDDEDDDDDDDAESSQDHSKADAAQGRAGQTITELDRQVLSHLRRRARREAKALWKSAKGASHVVSNGVSGTARSPSDQTSAGLPKRNVLSIIKALSLWMGRVMVYSGRLFVTALRYTWHATRLVYHSILYALQSGGRIFLTVYSTLKYVLAQILRPIRVLLAPVIYLWLGAKWIMWDIPSYWIFITLRELYPLYVFCGAGLALGTGIGIICALVLWMGAFVFQSTSPLEAHLDAWRSSETSELNKRLDFEQKNEKMLRALAKSALEKENARALRSNGRDKGKERAVGLRTGRIRRHRSVDDDDYESLTLGRTQPGPQGGASDEQAGDIGDDPNVPDYLRGLGKAWRPLPEAGSRLLSPSASSPASGSPSSSASEGRAINGGDEARAGSSRPSRAQDDYFSLQPPLGTPNREQARRSSYIGELSTSPSSLLSARGARSAATTPDSAGSSLSSTLKGIEAMRRRRGATGSLIAA